MTRGADRKAFVAGPGPGREDMEGGEARKWHDGQKSERVFQFALYHQYDCPDPDHDCPFLPLAVAESAYLPLLFLRGRRGGGIQMLPSEALMRYFLREVRRPPARPRAAIKCFCLRSTPCLPPRTQGN